MKSTNYRKSRGYTFLLFFKKILKHQANDYYYKLKHRCSQETMFSYLFLMKKGQLYIVGKYFLTERFYNVIGLSVDTIDKEYIYIVRIDKYIKFLLLWNNLRLQAVLQFNILRITLKPAICNKQVAGFLLTKYLYFQLKVLKAYYIFLHFFNLDKLYLLQFLKYSLGCRSPPYLSDFPN
jgi:hypothetical protein